MYFVPKNWLVIGENKMIELENKRRIFHCQLKYWQQMVISQISSCLIGIKDHE